MITNWFLLGSPEQLDVLPIFHSVDFMSVRTLLNSGSTCFDMKSGYLPPSFTITFSAIEDADAPTPGPNTNASWPVPWKEMPVRSLWVNAPRSFVGFCP